MGDDPRGLRGKRIKLAHKRIKKAIIDRLWHFQARIGGSL
jgi:hypothetical protein